MREVVHGRPVKNLEALANPEALEHFRDRSELAAWNRLRIICPNGHLGFAPMRDESFQLGVAARPDCIAADSGSDDVGPIPLGSDTSTSPLAWQTHDLEQMLLASRELGVPMIIGSSGDTGVEQPRRPVRADHPRARGEASACRAFKLGYFYSEVDKERPAPAHARRRDGRRASTAHADLTEAELDATDAHRRDGRRASVHRAAASRAPT